MSVTLASPPTATTETAEQRFVMRGIPWDAYVAICDALDEHSGVRLIYSNGKLIFIGKSRRHERLAESLDHLVLAVAAYLGIECEPSGEATYRRREKEAGVEGDRTFHFLAPTPSACREWKTTILRPTLRQTWRSKSKRATLLMRRSPPGVAWGYLKCGDSRPQHRPAHSGIGALTGPTNRSFRACSCPCSIPPISSIRFGAQVNLDRRSGTCSLRAGSRT
jgi:hypothetical protein